MARKPRLEVEGGLYHLITRGVERRDIFHTADDYRKFLSLLAVQKEKLPFFLYAYCLMTNHVHLLIERMTDDVGRIMHRVLTGYTQYYNRKGCVTSGEKISAAKRKAAALLRRGKY
jgi:REP element-mobilizing transposase RayT